MCGSVPFDTLGAGAMATVDECRDALRSLTGRLAENAAQNSTKVDLDRTIAIRGSEGI